MQWTQYASRKALLQNGDCVVASLGVILTSKGDSVPPEHEAG